MADIWFLRGQCHRFLHKYDEAFRDFTRALELDPENTEALFERACLHEGPDYPERAIRDLDALLKLDIDPELAKIAREMRQELVEDR